MNIDTVNEAVFRRFGKEDGSTILMLHCFGDSSSVFDQVVKSPDLQRYNIVAPDLWGFGTSSASTEIQTIAQFTDALCNWTEFALAKKPLGIVAHSIMSAMAVGMAEHLGTQVKGLFSIEGCLTPDDPLFPIKAIQFEDAYLFKQSYKDEIRTLAQNNAALTHYYSGVTNANPETLWELGKDTYRESRDFKLADAYKNLSQPSLYYWSQASTPISTQNLLKNYGIANKMYPTNSHWPMIDDPHETAAQIAAFFDQIFKQ